MYNANSVSKVVRRGRVVGEIYSSVAVRKRNRSVHEKWP